MKYISLMLIMTITFSCKNDKQSTTKPSIENKNENLFFVGTYTDTKSDGIYTYSLSDSGKIKKIKLAAKTENPSFLTKSTDGNFLLAVNELNSVNGKGTVESYKILGDSLEFISKESSGGAHPCFVTVNENGYVLTANYSSGNIGLLKINESGTMSELLDVQEHNINLKKDKTAHAHSAYFTNNNDFISADLGTNELWLSSIDTDNDKIISSKPSTLKISGENPGPRHISFHPKKDWVYVINELNSTITLVKKADDGQYKIENSFSTLPKDYAEKSFCADIHISNDGKFLYGSNRGHNSIAIFEINQDSGELNAIGFQSVKGDWPRNFALSPDNDFLLVANQRSENIVSFKRNKTTGLLSFVEEIDVPSPVCILF
ncbi:lactonase family protein [Aureibaculum sp. 2210JD6-5]|uniref:lactonase family protein n=1 Tax=Aureibaculum sp. 2210JD6-5 TaxID=3103957 RepID=UPI002AAC5D5C|nr:lactonase family protein [Aureibaculum sp. 2210JD6-5]MDY7393716.1 lactonase family protein [Aureibaculum sp. 2210JD6-5]